MSPDVSFGSPEFFPHSLDACNDTVSFIRLSRADYLHASFLDGRILRAGTPAKIIPWGQVAGAIAAARLEERCSFIFHIGHVGSTLLSRLLGAHPDVFALREPLLLRTLADIQAQLPGAPRCSDVDIDGHLDGIVKLLSRTFETRQRAVIKATSFVSEMAAAFLARAAAPSALFMYVSPEAYLATILGGPNSRREGRLLTPGRLRRLHRRMGHEEWPLDSLSEGEALAMGWACEMSALAQAAAAAGDRVRRVDFDRFLSHPEAELTQAMRHLRLDTPPGAVQAILEGPDMTRYSKAPEHAYDAALRLEVLTEARAVHRIEILKGLRWLDRAAGRTAAVGDALSFFSRLP
jgi:hypothetical protein